MDVIKCFSVTWHRFFCGSISTLERVIIVILFVLFGGKDKKDAIFLLIIKIKTLPIKCHNFIKKRKHTKK